MGTLQQIHRWSLTHHPRWLVVLRVALGICLFIKGISFVVNAANLEQLMKDSILAKYSEWLAIGITWAHLLGGFLIIIGLMTRWAALLQIPILIGAIIFINLHRGAFSMSSEMPFSIIVLLMLIFFVVEGSGPLSLDKVFREEQ